MVSGVVAIETNDRCDETYPVCGTGVAPVEIVLGQRPYHAVATKKQSQRLNDCCLTAVVGANEYGVRDPNRMCPVLMPRKFSMRRSAICIAFAFLTAVRRRVHS
jgi:hypothetical protein